MKIKYLYIVLFVVCSACLWRKNQVKSGYNDVLIENVEALADFEAMFGSGNKHIVSAITEHLFNEEPYRWSAIIECEEGGKFGCEAGQYGRNKESDPWIRIG